MAAIKVKPTEQTLIDAIAADATLANSDGIQVQPSTPYASTVYPLEGYADIVYKRPELITDINDGNKGYLAPLIRRIGPIFAQQYALFAVTTSFTTIATTLVSYTFPESFEVSRQVEINVQGNCSSNIINTKMDFWVEVNGVATQAFRHYLSAASTHGGFAGSWVVTLPTGAVTVVVKGQRTSGTGTLSFTNNNFCNMTIRG